MGFLIHPSAQVAFRPSQTGAPGIRTSLALGTIGIVTYTTPQVNANQLYPIRIVNATSNLIPVQVGTGNTYSVLSMRIKENSQTFGAFGTPIGTVVGTHGLSNLFVAPIIGNGPATNAPRKTLSYQ